MTFRGLGPMFVALLLIAAQPLDLAACGDKFLVATRGTRFQRAGLVRRPATVLVYAAPGRFAQTLERLGALQALTKVGYRPTVVADRAAFDQALQGQTFDVVLADLADQMAPLPSAGPGARPATIVVALDTPKDAVAAARRAHDGVVRAPSRARTLVDAVDDVLFTRALRGTAPSRTGN